MNSQIKERNYKVVLVGDPNVGKTSIALRHAQGSFPSKHHPTLGANFVIWETQVKGTDIKLIIGDSGSQERFYNILPTYFKGALAAALVYDITNKTSFEKLDFWLEKLRSGVGNKPFILIGNKLDLETKREVTREQAESQAKKYGVEYLEVSAKNNVNLQEMFLLLADKAIEQDKRE